MMCSEDKMSEIMIWDFALRIAWSQMVTMEFVTMQWQAGKSYLPPRGCPQLTPLDTFFKNHKQQAAWAAAGGQHPLHHPHYHHTHCPPDKYYITRVRRYSMAIYAWSIVVLGLIFACNGRAFCPSSVKTSDIFHQHTPLSIIWNVNNDARYQLQTPHSNIWSNNDDRRCQFQLQPIQSRKSATSILYSSTTSSSSPSSNEKNNGDDASTTLSTRSKLRQLTGFSMTALRSTLRAATGISLSQTISNDDGDILEGIAIDEATNWGHRIYTILDGGQEKSGT